MDVRRGGDLVQEVYGVKCGQGSPTDAGCDVIIH